MDAFELLTVAVLIKICWKHYSVVWYYWYCSAGVMYFVCLEIIRVTLLEI